MPRIAVLDDYQDVALISTDAWQRLPADCQVEFFHDHIFEEEPLAERLQPFEIVVCMRERTPMPGSLLRRLPNLKLLITTGARNLSFDMPATKELGITVAGTGSAGSGTSELAWGLIIGLLRQIPQEYNDVRAGGWQTTVGIGLEGRTLGLLGLGNLGSRVAKVGVAFGMNVLAWSQNLTAERAAEFGAKLVTKQELLSQSDIVSIHLVLGDRTRGLLQAEDLALMKPTAILVNTSRGPIVNEQALIAALREKRIAGAALDTFDVEPLPADHAFRRLGNVLVTPHLGYVTEESYEVFFRHVVENILGYLDGATPRVIAVP